MIRKSVLTKKCDISGELLPISSKPMAEEVKISGALYIKEKCPCIVKHKDGTEDVCGRAPKENGRCGLHRKTCRLPEEQKAPLPIKLPEEKAPSPAKPAENQRASLPGRVPSPAKQAEKQRAPSPAKLPEEQKAPLPAKEKRAPSSTKEKCPCIVVTRQGEKRVCGNAVKKNGVCGIHAKKCNLPEGAPIARPSLQPTIIEFEEKKVEEEGRCECIIRARKKGEKDRVCGRPIKKNGRCNIHQKTCITEGTATTCPCIVKKTGKICGRKTKPNGRCAFHQITCTLPEKEPEIKATAVAPTSPEVSQELDELSQEIDDLFQEEEESKSVISEPEIVAEPEKQEDWTFANAENIDKVYDYVIHIPEEEIDIGDQAPVAERILSYLRQ